MDLSTLPTDGWIEKYSPMYDSSLKQREFYRGVDGIIVLNTHGASILVEKHTEFCPVVTAKHGTGDYKAVEAFINQYATKLS